MSRQFGQRVRKRSEQYGTLWNGHNLFGDTKPTVPMFEYRCPVCNHVETRTRQKPSIYCFNPGFSPKILHAKPVRMRLYAIGSQIVVKKGIDKKTIILYNECIDSTFNACTAQEYHHGRRTFFAP